MKLEWRVLSDPGNDDGVTLEARDEDMLSFDDDMLVVWSSIYHFVCDDTVAITFMVSHSFVVDDRPNRVGNGYVYTIRKKEVIK